MVIVAIFLVYLILDILLMMWYNRVFTMGCNLLGLAHRNNIKPSGGTDPSEVRGER